MSYFAEKECDSLTSREVTCSHGVQVYSPEVVSYTVQPRCRVGNTIWLCVSSHCEELRTVLGSPGRFMSQNASSHVSAFDAAASQAVLGECWSQKDMSI